jgi:hypothetical protein
MAKIKPPAPISEKGPVRIVEQRPTVQEVDPKYDEKLSVDKQRVDFREGKFIQAIRQKGYFLTWRKAVICPCVNTETEQAAMNCDVCDGSGFFYIDPQEVQAIMTGFSRQFDVYGKAGFRQSGETVVTVEPQYRIGYRDSFEMKDSIAVFSEWFAKSNRRGIRSKLPDGVDSARYRITNVNSLFYLDSNGTPVRLEKNFHFKVQKDGWIEWTPEGNKIPDQTAFSIHYDFKPVYIVTSHPHTLRDTVSKFKRAKQTVVSLPLQASVMLDFLIDVNVPLPVTGGCG